jgi:hypothetical protein
MKLKKLYRHLRKQAALDPRRLKRELNKVARNCKRHGLLANNTSNLLVAFSWMDSPQGHVFWSRLYGWPTGLIA